MKLQIENWADENLTGNAKELFKEAVICFKAGAYRSSFLMSYLAFKLTIRERVIDGRKPDEISEGCWDNAIIKPLKNDDCWEEQMNKLVDSVASTPKEIGRVFRFTNIDRMKNRYVYWKNIRNSCAHAKAEHISSATVEQFWNYMQDDMPEYYVLGGKTYLSECLIRIYKYYHSIGKDELEKILKEISCIYKSDVQACFEDLFINVGCQIVINEETKDFWDTIVHMNDENICNGFVDFLSKHCEQFITVYQYYPQIYGWMESRHKTYIQEYIVPLLEKGYHIEGGADTFCNLLCDILKGNKGIINLETITSNKQKFAMIANNKLGEMQLDVLHKYKVFKKFLLNAARCFFYNDSLSQWDYYGPYGEISDEDVIKCFQYAEWDIELIQHLNDTYTGLIENLHFRSNEDSKRNGRKREEAYRQIVIENKDCIEEVILQNGKSISGFSGIEKLISL